MSELNDYNKTVMVDNKKHVIQLEKMLVDGALDNLPQLIESRKRQLVKKMIEFNEKVKYTTTNKKGEEIECRRVNAYIISNYFFKSINPMSNVEPKYSAEKLSIVFEYFCYVLGEINISIGNYMPTITTFCRFAGITKQTFDRYKVSNDESMRNVCEKINDYCYDAQISMAQEGVLREKSTIYRMKTEQNISEKPQEKTINVEHNINIDESFAKLKRVKELKELTNYRVVDVKEGKND